MKGFLFLFLIQLAWLPRADARPELTTIEYFGLIIHRSDQGTAWPGVRFGSWRLWDAYVNWEQLENKKGKWDFSRLDRYVAMAELNHIDILLPLSNTPQWAAARPNDRSGYKPGNSSEPANMEDWRRYVRTIGERYKGRIRHYQVWNEPNIKLFYTGTPAKLVELTCEASKILKEIDSRNQVVSAGSSPGGKDHSGYLNTFLALGGKDCIDIVGHHFYVPLSSPEAMVPLIREVRDVMEKNGIGHKSLWNTETGWWIENGDGTPDHQMVARGGWKKIPLAKAGDLIERAFILARAEGVDRFFWYSWDSLYGLGLVEPTWNKPKPIIDKWNNIVSRLINSSKPICMVDGKNWSCTYTNDEGVDNKISWTLE